MWLYLLPKATDSYSLYLFLISLYINKWNSLTRRSRLVLYEFLTGRETTFYCTKVLKTLGRNVCTLYKKKKKHININNILLGRRGDCNRTK